MQNSTEPVLSLDDRIATITLSKPLHANRLSVHDLETLRMHVAQVNKNEHILVLKFVAKGKYFCSGYDINIIGTEDTKSSLFFGETIDVIESARPVTIAAIQGGVYGGGSDLCLACDFRFGTPETNMFVPAAKLGLHFYPGGLKRYVTRLGIDNAKKVFLTAARFDADNLQRMGFLTDLVDSNDLDACVNELAESLSRMAPSALTTVKQHLNLIAEGKWLVDDINALVLKSEQSKDIQEGVQAWKEKRAPVFKGQ